MRSRVLCYIVLASGALALGVLLGRFLIGGNEIVVPEAVAQGGGRLTIKELQEFSSFPVFWLGEEYQGLSITDISYVRDQGPPDGGRPPIESVTIIYGACDPGPPELGEGGCVPPLQIITDRFCLNRPSFLAQAARKGLPFEVRDAQAQQTQSGWLHLYTGESTVAVFSTEGDGATLQAANALQGANAQGRARTSDTTASLDAPMREEDCVDIAFPTLIPVVTPTATPTTTIP